MSVQAVWEAQTEGIITRRVYRIDIVGQWKAAELLERVKMGVDDAAGNEYATLINYESSVIPPDLIAVGKDAYALTPPNLRLLVLVAGSNNLLRTLARFFQNLFAGRFKVRLMMVESLDEAYQMVADFYAEAKEGA